MNGSELIEKLRVLDGELPIIVRGMDVVADISNVYIDHDHTDDSPFIAIDLEDEI